MIFATVCAGGLVAAESALLLISMNVPTVSSWTTRRNVLLAFSDILLGSLVAGLVVFGNAAQVSWLYYAAIAVLLLTHLYREGEFLAGRNERFARSAALFVVNNVRLGLLALSLGLTLRPG